VTETPAPAQTPTPGLARRLACLLYEGVLLFGVVWFAGFLYGVVTQQRHALVGAAGLQTLLFLVLAGYFVFFWSKTGQTLAMLTWHIRLVTDDGKAVSPLRALLRYLLAWMWFLPALLLLQLQGLHGAGSITAMVLTGVLGYAALARLDPGRQYLHDVICKTRLVIHHPPRRGEAISP